MCVSFCYIADSLELFKKSIHQYTIDLLKSNLPWYTIGDTQAYLPQTNMQRLRKLTAWAELMQTINQRSYGPHVPTILAINTQYLNATNHLNPFLEKNFLPTQTLEL